LSFSAPKLSIFPHNTTPQHHFLPPKKRSSLKIVSQEGPADPNGFKEANLSPLVRSRGRVTLPLKH